MTDGDDRPERSSPPEASSERFMRLFADHRREVATGDARTLPSAPGGTSSLAAAEIAAFGELVRERYTIERELGRGGMGVVLLGHDRRLERRVAIKVLPRAHGGGELSQQRFLREARTVARLSHPHIVPILHAEEAGPFAYFTMAYVEGETLAERVRSGGPLPLAEAVKVLREVAWALAYAHASGVVHRDVKPENILLERGSGRALVSDFGIAHRAGDPGLTGPEHVVGTALYMSPEQAQGHELDGRSDLYSLGVVGFWLLADRHPHPGENPVALLLRRSSEPAPRLREAAPEVPPALAAVIDRCLARSPAERFHSGEELAGALERALHGGARSVEEQPLGEPEIAATLALAAELRRDLRAERPTDSPVDAACAALARRLGERFTVDLALFQRLALICSGDGGEIRLLAAAHGYLLPDPRSSTAADLRAMFEAKEDGPIFARLLELSHGLPPHHALIRRLHLVAARVRAHRGAARVQSTADARMLHDLRDVAARLLDLRGEAAVDPAFDPDGATLGLYHEILARVRENDGVRAAKRLLDLARVRGVARSQLQSLGALVERVGEEGARADASDDSWFALLAEVLDAAGALILAATDEQAITAQSGELRRGGLVAAKELFLARRGGAAPASAAICKCDDVGKSYRRRRGVVGQVLGGVSLELHPGTITGVVGPNGCGKTTLLRIVAGQLAPDVGSVTYPRLDPSGAARGTTDWQDVAPRIGYVAQRPERWYGGLGDNLHRWAALHGVLGEDNEIEVEFYLNRLDLVRYRDARWDELSGGYRMRFELARVMVARPRLLVLDEPLAPLDIRSQEIFLNDLRDLADMDGQQLPIILSSQHISEVESIADTLLCLDQGGRPRFCGPARAIVGPDEERVYELGGAVSRDVIEFLGRQFTLQAHRAGERWILRLPADVSEDRLLRALVSRAGSVEYFRDITQSCVRFFRGREP